MGSNPIPCILTKITIMSNLRKYIYYRSLMVERQPSKLYDIGSSPIDSKFWNNLIGRILLSYGTRVLKKTMAYLI